MSALSSSSRWIGSISAALTSAVLFGSILQYYLHKFNTRKKEMIILRRYPDCVNIITMFATLLVTIQRPLDIINQGSPMEIEYPSVFRIIERINITLYCIFGYGIMYLFAARFWLMFYDLKYASSVMNKKWRVYLDPSVETKDFWLRHKPLLASTPFVIKVISVLWTLSGLLFGIAWQLSVTTETDRNGAFKTLVQIGHAVLLVVPILSYTILYCKTPHVLDLFYLGYEIKILTIYQWMTVAYYMVVIIMTYIVTNVMRPIPILIFIVYLLPLISGSIIVMMWSLPSTYCVLRKIQQSKDKDYKQKDMELEKTVRRPAMEKTMGLQRILLNENYAELFIQHLCREFCVETIISFIEFMQFKDALKMKYLRDNETERTNAANMSFIDYSSCDLSLNESIPKSSTVYNAETDAECDDKNDMRIYLTIAHKLYEKYIRNDAELSINISGDMRESYDEDMNSKTIFLERKKEMKAIDLFEYFDPIIEEMFLLMLSSFDRFLQDDLSINIARIFLVNHNSTQIGQLL